MPNLPPFKAKKKFFRPAAIENDLVLVADRLQDFAESRQHMFDLRFTSIFPVQIRSLKRYGPAESLISLPEEDVFLSGDFVLRKFLINVNNLVNNSEQVIEITRVIRTYKKLNPADYYSGDHYQMQGWKKGLADFMSPRVLENMYPKLETKLGYFANSVAENGRMIAFGAPTNQHANLRPSG